MKNISEPDTSQLDSDHQEDDIQQMEPDSDDCIIEKGSSTSRKHRPA